MPYSIIIIFVLLINYSNANQQFISESPNDQQAKIGDQAILKCKIKNLKGEPQWCIDDFCLGVSKKDANSIPSNNAEPKDANGANENNNNNNSENNMHLKGRPRYRIIGDKSKGEFHLLIEPVQLQDNMFFYCMATAASETIRAVKSKKVFLTVLTNPQSLHLDNPVHVSLNKPSTIQCTARQSRPPVKIMVSINGYLINDESKYKTEIVQVPVEQQQPQEDSSSSDSDQNKKKLTYISSISSITPEQLRQSYYDTTTNVTIDDITMKMQGQTVECFAYSLTSMAHQHNGNNRHLSHFNLNSNKNTHQNNVMSTKSLIQVDCKFELFVKLIVFSLWFSLALSFRCTRGQS
jgi:hypothetical protein